MTNLTKLKYSPWLALAASLLLSSAAPVRAQSTPAVPATAPDRTQAYYHAGLASMYAEDALSEGRPELLNKAIEEYKVALNADPASPALNIALASLYFGAGRVREAETSARALLKTSPDDLDAHKLLGRIYLRQLGEGQAPPAVLDSAIAEYEKLVSLDPKKVDTRMILGQLYTVKHDAKKAEAAFAAARDLDPDSEEVVLNMARLYAESGDLDRAAKAIENVPVNDRTPRMEFILGATYDQLKKLPLAVAAYQRANDLEPGDLHTLEALAQALLTDSQLDEALKQYQALSTADPQNAEALVKIAEIQRRQGHFVTALETIHKARKIEPNSLEAGYNEGLLLDVLGRFDEAIQTYAAMVDVTSHANGAYTAEEKANRSIFLERLGAVYLEQNHTEQAIAAFQKMIDMGGDTAVRGYQGQVDVYRNAKQYAKAIEVSRKAVETNPKNREMKLMLAGELADQNKAEEGFTLLKGLLANSEEDRSVWITMAQMHVRLHQWKEAEEALNKVESYTKKKEDRVYLVFLRGEVAERQKHYEPAENFFRQVLELDSSNSLTLNYYGYMLADKSARLPEALKLIRRAVEIEPMNGAYLDSLGWCYFKMGDYELAEDNLRKAVDRDQTDPTVHDHLAELYEKTGRIRLAVAQWEIALKQFAVTSPGDFDPADVTKVQKKLDGARVKLARQDNALGPVKPE
ncbi:MAG: tetratricopeptide repeat protein [Terracidiphilus sp.]|nr:tetratricopeptide repeat protein [Terracidiphilus sp.]